MNLDEIKKQLIDAELQAKKNYENFSNQSAVNRAAFQIIQFEKEYYYGDVGGSRHLQKVRDIIKSNLAEIIDEISQNKN